MVAPRRPIAKATRNTTGTRRATRPPRNGCAPVPAPAGPDNTPPRITLTVLSSPGAPHFDTSDPADAAMGACAPVRSFPAKLTLAASDASGIATLTLTSFPGGLATVSVAPASATAALRRDPASATSRLTVTPHPPSGSVQPNLLLTLTLDAPSGVVAVARDARGLAARLYQVDLRPGDGPLACGHR